VLGVDLAVGAEAVAELASEQELVVAGEEQHAVRRQLRLLRPVPRHQVAQPPQRLVYLPRVLGADAQPRVERRATRVHACARVETVQLGQPQRPLLLLR